MKTKLGRGRPRSRLFIICKERRSRLITEARGNLGALHRARYQRVPPGQWYAALRGEGVSQQVAQLIEDQ